MTDNYIPRPEHKFSFGLWTVSNRGRDPFGAEVRPSLPPVDAVKLLAEVGAWGVNLHDNDLVPIDATPAERDRIVKEFKQACDSHGIVVPMATVSLFYDPAFRDGAFTANDASVRAYAVQKTMRAMDIGAELGAKIFVLWGGREGTETDACRRAGRGRQATARRDRLPLRLLDRRGATATGSRSRRSRTSRAATSTWRPRAITSGSSPRSRTRSMVGVNPEVAHEQMAGLNFVHAVAQAWEAGKLFHIDLNDQAPGRYDQDFRFGAANPKTAFFLVKFLEDVGYDGPRHFDAHAYRTENYDGVKDFARGCMRTYLILKEKAARWNADAEIQALLAGDQPAKHAEPHGRPVRHRPPREAAGFDFDRSTLAAKRLPYERLDQLTIEVLLGVR